MRAKIYAYHADKSKTEDRDGDGDGYGDGSQTLSSQLVDEPSRLLKLREPEISLWDIEQRLQTLYSMKGFVITPEVRIRGCECAVESQKDCYANVERNNPQTRGAHMP